MSPLHDACLARDLLAVQKAIKTGWKINDANEAGVTPLMCAALVNCRETAEELLTHGATVGLADQARRHDARVQREPGGSAGTRSRACPQTTDALPQRRATALHYCAKSGSADVAKILIAHGADMLASDKDGKTPYDVSLSTNHLHLRALLRPHTVSALRADTAGAELERRRLAEQLGLRTPIGVVPPTHSGTSTVDQNSDLQAQLNARNSETTLEAPPVIAFPTRLDVQNLHPHLLPTQAGMERVLLLETLSDKARWLSCSAYDAAANLLRTGRVDCKLFCWDAARPRAYVRVSENAFEVNSPVICCPSDACIHDSNSKIYFDKLLHAKPFRARCCSPYNFCCGKCEPCGETVAFAPYECMANEFCLCICTPCFRFVPGLNGADALVDFYKLAHADFVRRKQPATDLCGCFHKKNKGK